MAETKTKATEVSVEAFIDAVEPESRRADAKVVNAMMTRISGEQPRMWGPSIIGFGSYHYKYETGHEGDACRLGFSPRKTELVLYLLGAIEDQDAKLARLGKHKTGKSCLYIKKLSDVDMDVLEELTREVLAYMNKKYPA